MVGGFIAVGGVWHILAPWAMGYSDVRPAVVNDVVVGAAFIVCGAVLAAAPRLGWPIWACGLLAVWVLAAPSVLGDWTRGMAVNEAMWSGLGTLGLVAILGVVHRFGGAPPVTRSGRAPA